MTEIDIPNIVTDVDIPGKNLEDPFDVANLHAREMERVAQQAYATGVLHGINAQSMAQAKNDVMEFEDYDWEL